MLGRSFNRCGVRLGASVLFAALVAGCAGGGDAGDGVGDEDVVDESAGEEAIAVLEGAAPGVAVIVEYPEGAAVDELTEALRDDYGLTVTSRYREVFEGAAFIAPDPATVDALLADERVADVFADALVDLPSPTANAAMEAEADAAFADASAAGEVDTADASDQSIRDIRSEDELTPQHRSTGWRLIHGERIANDGAGGRVAVIDTGVDIDHHDLADNISNMGKDCVRRKNKTMRDPNGHGTHVAGIIAAQNNGFGIVGLAPAAEIVPVRVLDKKGRGAWSTILCGIDYVARRADRIDVANLSLGASCGEPCENFRAAPHEKGLRKLVRKGVFVAVAAGNDGIPAEWATPAHLDEVVTVSAYLDWNGKTSDSDRYAHFSNYGSGVDIGAPGVRIMSSLPGDEYQRWNGTSMATPFVAAAAVIIEQASGGDLSPEEILDIMLEEARTTYPGRGGDHPERLLWLRK